MTGADAKALIDIFVARGCDARALASEAERFISRDAMAAIAQLIDGGASVDVVAVAVKLFIDQLAAKRARNKADQDVCRRRKRERQRAPPDVSSDSQTDGHLTAKTGNVPPTPPLNSDLDDDDDARARAAEKIAAEIEQIVTADRHWPPGGWNHAALVDQVRKRLQLGQRESIILAAVRGASARLVGGTLISSFSYFDRQIAADHDVADRDPQLKLEGGRNPRLKAAPAGGSSQSWKLDKAARETLERRKSG